MAIPSLFSNQVDYIRAHENKINDSFFFINTGETGSGKTVTTIYLSKIYNLPLFVLGPANIEENWQKECKKYDAKLTFVSYSKLARGNSGFVRQIEKSMAPTQQLIDLIKSRVLVIYDEAQDVKNPKALCFAACNEISKLVISLNCGSRIAILSATLIDEVKFAESTFKLTGIISKKELFYFNPGDKRYTLKGYGYNEALEYCAKLDPVATSKCIPQWYNSKQIKKALYDLLVNVIMPNMSYMMRRPQIKAQFKPILGYYKMEPQDEDNLKAALNELMKAVRYDPATGSIMYQSDTISNVIQAHHKMEAAKLNLFTRLVNEKLKENEFNKVIVYLWYKDNLNTMMDRFKDYNPLKLNGDVDPGTRYQQLNERFMQPNNNCRLIFAHPKAAGVGLSFDDTYGQFPRFTFMSSGYHFIMIHQCAGRSYRTSTKSDASFSIVYGKDIIENSIMNALYRKTEVLQGINSNADIVYPASYPVYVEN